MEEIHDGDTLWRFGPRLSRVSAGPVFGAGAVWTGPSRPSISASGAARSVLRACDVDEARMIVALAATLDPARFERHAEAGESGIFTDSARNHTRVIEGAVHLPQSSRVRRRSRLRAAPGGNRCRRAAARLEAVGVLAAAYQGGLGTGPRRERGGHGTALDAAPTWGPEGEEMAWCCTEGPLAYVSDRAVIDSLRR